VGNAFYIRHISSCLGVAGVQALEAHSLSLLIDGLNLTPISNSNYLGYIICQELSLLLVNIINNIITNNIATLDYSPIINFYYSHKFNLLC